MPYVVRKRGSKWAIVNANTGRVAGTSSTRANAEASARIRNAAHKKP